MFNSIFKIMKNKLYKIGNLFKKSFLIILTLTSICGISAQTVNTEFETLINLTFAGIDKSKVPHSLLVDYAMEFTELSAYDGTLSSDNLTHRGHYTDIYNTLLMSRVQIGVSDLVNPNTFNSNWDSLRETNKIVLSGLYYKYSKFKANAHPNFVTISNNKMYDKYINGVWQNPYEEQQVFAIAPPILKYNNLIVDVELPATLWYTNQASEVQSIAIDFGEGNGYQIMTFGQIKTISYSQAGIYEWKYKLALNSSQVLYSHSKIQFVQGPNRIPFSQRFNQN